MVMTACSTKAVETMAKSRRRFIPGEAPSRQTFVFGKVVIGGVFGLVNLHAARCVVTRIEYTPEKRQLKRPRRLGRGAAITAWHGVVEPAVRRAGIDLDRVGLVVAIETVAQAPHVGERDHVVGFAENAEHRAIDARNHVIERFWELVIDLPFLVTGRAVPDER